MRPRGVGSVGPRTAAASYPDDTPSTIDRTTRADALPPLSVPNRPQHALPDATTTRTLAEGLAGFVEAELFVEVGLGREASPGFAEGSKDPEAFRIAAKLPVRDPEDLDVD